jgi:predicted MFS family arabinose efflux permease
MFGLIREYRRLEKSVLNLICAEFFIQLINASFLSIQLIYMQKCGYSDHESAGFVSFRFLGVLLFALPLGLFIKSRNIKPFFYLSCFAVPTTALLIIYSTWHHLNGMLYLSQFLWGISFTFIQIPIMPYLLRNAKRETQTEAIALSYSTYSFAGIVSGILIYVLNTINPGFFNEKLILEIIAFSGFVSAYFVYKAKVVDHVTNEAHKIKHFSLKGYDWKLISKALFPTLIIAVGAGLTIPFISIFFFNVHHLDTDRFSIISSVAAVLVAIGAVLVPKIKREIGYKIAIPATQSFAVLALVLLATTQFYSYLPISVYIAVCCFILRQPLMNMAGPMTSEVVMNYVGHKNREIVSALTSAIWSGSWFVSSIIFKELRQRSVPYVDVFLITAFLYGIGVVMYYFLILDYNRREKAGMITYE